MATAIESFWILQQRPHILLFLFHVQMQLVEVKGKDAKSPRLGFNTSWFPICLLSKIRNGFKICHVEFPQNYNSLYLKWRNAGDISISSMIYLVPKSSKIFPVPRCFDPLKAFTGSAWGSKTFTRLHSQGALTRCLERQRVEMTGLEMFISHPFVACLIMAMLLCFPSHNNMYSQTNLHRKLQVKDLCLTMLNPSTCKKHVKQNSETTNQTNPFCKSTPCTPVFYKPLPNKTDLATPNGPTSSSDINSPKRWYLPAIQRESP